MIFLLNRRLGGNRFRLRLHLRCVRRKLGARDAPSVAWGGQLDLSGVGGGSVLWRHVAPGTLSNELSKKTLFGHFQTDLRKLG